jgi:hypothetical protein
MIQTANDYNSDIDFMPKWSPSESLENSGEPWFF